MTDKFEKDILSEINSFRSNPRSIQHQIEVLQKGISRLRSNDPFLKEIDNFIASIDRIPKMKPLILNKTLCQIAREEVKKFIKNESSYNPYLTGAQMKGVVPSGFLEQNAALIADSGADEAETVVPKLLLNKVDKEKKGRQILCTPDYTQVGIASRENEGENYYVIIFANEDSVEEGDPQLPEGDLTELKQAFDLYDHDGSQKIRIKECIEGMKSVNFDKTNPILFDIICDLEGEEWCSWPKFAYHVYSSITDRNTDQGLRTLFDLFIDDPKKDTITFDTFKRICREVGENMSDDEMKNILEITTQSGNDISFEDFCQYMKLTA
jgi:Ca2+-binding EF-hand superfamily protein